MARYRRVETGLWTDERFRELSAPGPNGQSLWLYLLTGPRTTIFPGLIVAREAVMADDLGWSVESFREAFGEPFRKGMAKAGWKTGLVVLTRGLLDSSGEPRETARPANPNVLKSWASSWDDIPECALKTEYLRTLESFAEGLGSAFAKAFREAFRKALAKDTPQPSPIQDQDQDQDQYVSPRAPEEVKSETPAQALRRRRIAEANRIWQEHTSCFDELRQRFVVDVPPMRPPGLEAIGWKDLLERLKGYGDDLDRAVKAAEHVLAVRREEVKSADDLRWFGDIVWRADQFARALPKRKSAAAMPVREAETFDPKAIYGDA